MTFKDHNCHMKTTLVLFILFGLNSFSYALEFQSGANKVNLIELYTSEGCSSCPPADEWLSTLKENSELWKRFVPVSFHVNYWDYLGWKDKFAQAKFTDRQERYAIKRAVSTVYTPAVLLNGKGWRSWRFYKDYLDISPETPGNLSANLTDTFLEVNFTSNMPDNNFKKPLILHVALLGNNIVSNIKRGENEGKVLTHDFVTLSLSKKLSKQPPKHSVNYWKIPTQRLDKFDDANAIAIWVSTRNDPTPIQASGSFLK